MASHGTSSLCSSQASSGASSQAPTTYTHEISDVKRVMRVCEHCLKRTCTPCFAREHLSWLKNWADHSGCPVLGWATHARDGEYESGCASVNCPYLCEHMMASQESDDECLAYWTSALMCVSGALLYWVPR